MTITGKVGSNPVLLATTLKIAKDFESGNYYSKLNAQDQNKVVDLLSVDAPLELVGKLVDDQEYWRRKSQSKWRNCDIQYHGDSWKQLFFERNLSDVLERFDPETQDIRQVQRLAAYSRKYIRNLVLQQLPSHLDLSILLDTLQNSCCGLSVCYGLNEVGMDYDRSLFGMKLDDCRQLAKALESCETLVSLTLSNNMLDDDKVRMLASGLIDNISLTRLDLSHNKIADRGIRSLAKVLDVNSVIQILDLSDNTIHSEGGRTLARSLKSNQSLISINLTMNSLGDEGAGYLFDVLKHHKHLQKFSIGANGLTRASSHGLVDLIKAKTSLKHINLCCNSIDKKCGHQILEALQSNKIIENIDLRLCGLDELDYQLITDEIRSREEKAEKARFVKPEKSKSQDG